MTSSNSQMQHLPHSHTLGRRAADTPVARRIEDTLTQRMCVLALTLRGQVVWSWMGAQNMG